MRIAFPAVNHRSVAASLSCQFDWQIGVHVCNAAAVTGLSVAIVLIIAFTIGLAVLCVGLVFIRRSVVISRNES